MKRDNFGGRWAVIFAMAGSAIGLGNIWRFPYMVGKNGGAAFILLYVGATLLVSLPVFIAEVLLGRRSRCTASRAMSHLSGKQPFWRGVGVLCILIPLLIASYYSVIGGWSLEYFLKSCSGSFIRMSPDVADTLFGSFIASVWGPLAMHLLFMFLCCAIVMFGVKSGIEKFSKVSIPVLFFLIVGMAVYSMTLPGAGTGIRYLLKPDFSQIGARTCAYALGQSFYSLSLGMGAIVTYGSYVSREEDIVMSSAGTAVSDLLFAVIAGFAIMPAVFAAGIEPGSGPGLIFQSIPYIFSTLGTTSPILSTIVSVAFFLAVVVAAMTSCISLVEVGVSYLAEKWNFPRWLGCLVIFLLCGSIGAVCSLSFGPLSDVQWAGKGIFDFLDFFCSNILLLILSFFVVIFVGFRMKKADVKEEITNAGTKVGNTRLFGVFYFLIKWVAPIAIAVIFVTNFII